MKGALTFCCLWGHSHSPLCSPVGWPGTAGTCCHPQSASDYMISLSHSPHPASQATWKGLCEPPHTDQDGHTLTFQSSLYLNWGGTGETRMEYIYYIYSLPLVAYTRSVCICAHIHVCTCLLYLCRDAYWLATTLGEWRHSMQADHLSCQVQVADSS